MGNGARLALALAAMLGRFGVVAGLLWLGLWFIEVRAPNPWTDTAGELVVWVMLASLVHLVVGGTVLRFLWTAAQGMGVIFSRRR